MENVKTLKRYRPSFFFTNSWLQLAWLVKRKPDFGLKLDYEREIVPLKDGG
jgi:hypothetical protein